MEKLEDFIRNKQELFNGEEPPAGHLERFDTRLARFRAGRAPVQPIRLWMKIAAGILALITTGLIVFEMATYDSAAQTNFQEATLNLPDDLREVLSYYQKRSDQRLVEMENLAQNCPETARSITMTIRDLAQIENNLNELVVALQENPSDSRVQAALVQNYQARESLLDSYLLQANMENCKTKK